MSTREQLEAEAAELYPLYRIASNGGRAHLRHDTHTAHVRAKTISAEQVEAAAEAFHNAIDLEDDEGPMYWWHELSEHVRKLARHDMRVAFRAAGFYVEEDPDE